MPIKADDLTYVYSSGLPGETKALDGVSFEIQDGEVAGIIGRTGSGKSTLMQHLNGILKPQAGSVYVDDMCVSDGSAKMIEISRKVGLVFQYPEYQLFEETVEKDVAFGPRNLGIEGDELSGVVREAIELTGLDYESVKDRSPFELSGGQKRRVAIAGVIAMKPDVLILDEPTAGLDPEAHRGIVSMMDEIHRSTGITLIFVSHSMADVAGLADHVLVMDSGKIVLEGTPEEVFSHGSELQKLGLGLPPVMEIMSELERRTGEVDGSVFDAGDAAKEIYRYLEA
jgi:energy-coupling factor transporter ATPase